MGLDRIDRRVLECIIEKYDGGPVGLIPLRRLSAKREIPSKMCMNHI